MKIAIDLRSLHTGSISGVENYIINVVEALLGLDKQNSYTLFYNSFKPVNVEHLHFINSRVVKTRIPNKFLNISLTLFNRPKFEKLIGDFDCLFLPNLNTFALCPEKKLAVTVHDVSPFVTPEFYGKKDRIWHRLINIGKTLRRADIIFAVSEHTKNDLITLFQVPENKIRVAFPGIDHRIFKPDLPEGRLREVRNLYNLPGDYILFLNTLEPRKNLNGLVQAFERINTPVHLVIAGKPGYRHRQSFHRIQASRKKRFIHYIGYVAERDKPYIQKLAQALVYPSFYEGFGFQPLESFAVGVPVVATQVTSIPEIAQSSAIIVNPYNPVDIARAIDQVLQDHGLREILIRKGVEQAKNFTWENTALQILAGFTQALSL